jgi:hypothetical protein
MLEEFGLLGHSFGKMVIGKCISKQCIFMKIIGKQAPRHTPWSSKSSILFATKSETCLLLMLGLGTHTKKTSSFVDGEKGSRHPIILISPGRFTLILFATKSEAHVVVVVVVVNF